MKWINPDCIGECALIDYVKEYVILIVTIAAGVFLTLVVLFVLSILAWSLALKIWNLLKWMRR